MLQKIRQQIEAHLGDFVSQCEHEYRLKRISPLLFGVIKDFVLRTGKRVRPALFVIGYRGYSNRKPAGLFTSALAIELLHDFMLVHDDIIDKADLRRNKPTMHRLLDAHISKKAKVKFNGQDLAIVAGDVMYAMAIKAFLAIKEDGQRKEKALRMFIDAAVYTGSGEFIELLLGAVSLEKVSKKQIYDIYDYKTAFYTFASPLATGAILAGAHDKQVDALFKYGICLGRAFQIKDDMLGMFSTEKDMGKSALTDVREAKKTILIWHAYKNAGSADRRIIQHIFDKKKATMRDLGAIRDICKRTEVVPEIKKEIQMLLEQAQSHLSSSGIKKEYLTMLSGYASSLVSV